MNVKVFVSALVLGLTAAIPDARVTAAASGACALITQQEAAAAVGAPVTAGAETPMDFPVQGVVIKANACLFGSAVVVARYDLGSGARELFDRYRQEFATKPGSTDYQNIEDVGDEAFGAKGQLMIRKGQAGLLIGVTLGDRQNVRVAAKALQTEKALAALALGRM
jgi:hypothetical protein